MSEIIYQYTGRKMLTENDTSVHIRWLGEEDYRIFARHLELCGQRPISEDDWKEVYADGAIYCGLFEHGKMIARACREIISCDRWEIADVRVVREYRNRGHAFEICSFVLNYILSEGKIPSIRTEEDNYPMQSVIKKLGFTL